MRLLAGLKRKGVWRGKRTGHALRLFPFFAVLVGLFVLLADVQPAHALLGISGDAIIPWILAKTLYPVLGLFGWLTEKLFGILIDVAQYNDFLHAAAVERGWIIVRDVSNMFFIMVLLVIAFGTAFRIQQYRYNALLRQVIIMAVLINFSKLITGFMIDVTQVVMLTFVNAFADTAAGNLTTAAGLEKFLALDPNVQGDVSTLSVLTTVLFGLILVTILFLVTLAYVIILLMRIIALWLLTVLSPFAYVLNTFPGTKKYATEWWSNFWKYATIGPMLAFFLWLSLTISYNANLASQVKPNITPASTTAGSVTPAADNAPALASDGGAFSFVISKVGQSDNILSYMITIILLVASLGVAQKAGVAGGAVAGKLAGNIQTWPKILTGLTYGKTLQRPLEGLGRYAMAGVAMLNIPLASTGARAAHTKLLQRRDARRKKIEEQLAAIPLDTSYGRAWMRGMVQSTPLSAIPFVGRPLAEGVAGGLSKAAGLFGLKFNPEDAIKWGFLDGGGWDRKRWAMRVMPSAVPKFDRMVYQVARQPRARIGTLDHEELEALVMRFGEKTGLNDKNNPYHKIVNVLAMNQYLGQALKSVRQQGEDRKNTWTELRQFTAPATVPGVRPREGLWEDIVNNKLRDREGREYDPSDAIRKIRELGFEKEFEAQPRRRAREDQELPEEEEENRMADIDRVRYKATEELVAKRFGGNADAFYASDIYKLRPDLYMARPEYDQTARLQARQRRVEQRSTVTGEWQPDHLSGVKSAVSRGMQHKAASLAMDFAEAKKLGIVQSEGAAEAQLHGAQKAAAVGKLTEKYRQQLIADEPAMQARREGSKQRRIAEAQSAYDADVARIAEERYQALAADDKQKGVIHSSTRRRAEALAYAQSAAHPNLLKEKIRGIEAESTATNIDAETENFRRGLESATSLTLVNKARTGRDVRQLIRHGRAHDATAELSSENVDDLMANVPESVRTAAEQYIRANWQGGNKMSTEQVYREFLTELLATPNDKQTIGAFRMDPATAETVMSDLRRSVSNSQLSQADDDVEKIPLAGIRSFWERLSQGRQAEIEGFYRGRLDTEGKSEEAIGDEVKKAFFADALAAHRGADTGDLMTFNKEDANERDMAFLLHAAASGKRAMPRIETEKIEAPEVSVTEMLEGQPELPVASAPSGAERIIQARPAFAPRSDHNPIIAELRQQEVNPQLAEMEHLLRNLVNVERKNAEEQRRAGGKIDEQLQRNSAFLDELLKNPAFKAKPEDRDAARQVFAQIQDKIIRPALGAAARTTNVPRPKPLTPEQPAQGAGQTSGTRPVQAAPPARQGGFTAPIRTDTQGFSAPTTGRPPARPNRPPRPAPPSPEPPASSPPPEQQST